MKAIPEDLAQCRISSHKHFVLQVAKKVFLGVPGREAKVSSAISELRRASIALGRSKFQLIVERGRVEQDGCCVGQLILWIKRVDGNRRLSMPQQFPYKTTVAGFLTTVQSWQRELQ